jgi:CBS domain containing-hemolysin-like protein
LVVALDADVQLRRVRRLKSSRVSYFPVYQGDLDHVLGWVSKQKVLELLGEPSDDVHLADHVRPVGTIDENTPVTMLADAFLQAGSPFLVVTNAQGLTTGLMTLSEFIELVFGFELEAASQTAPSENASAPLLRNYEL